jgi:hypothetical protein
MEAADWASLSDQELLERRVSKLGLRLAEEALNSVQLPVNVAAMTDTINAQNL